MSWRLAVVVLGVALGAWSSRPDAGRAPGRASDHVSAPEAAVAEPLPPPWDRMGPALLETLRARGELPGSVRSSSRLEPLLPPVAFHVERSADLAAVLDALGPHGAVVLDGTRLSASTTPGAERAAVPPPASAVAWARVRPAELLAVAELPGVVHVEIVGFKSARLDRSLPQVGSDILRAAGLEGDGVVVGLVDSGVDGNHPAIGSVPWELDLTGDADPDPTDDRDGHGTRLAGVVLSRDGGFTGAAPASRIANAKVLSGGAASGADPTVVAGIDWASRQGSDVLLLGFGGPPAGGESDGQDPVSRQADHEAWVRNRLVVAASAESPVDAAPIAPGDAFNVVTVGASVADGTGVASFNVPGPTTDGRSKPDVVAPGAAVDLPDPDGIDVPSASWEGAAEDFVDAEGTSLAAAHVAGILAQLRSFASSEGLLADSLALKAVLLSTARRLDGWTSPGEDRPLDPVQGAGEVSAPSALRALIERGRLHQRRVLGTGPADSHWYALEVPRSDEPVTVTLAWERRVATSEAEEPGVSAPPLNDLDLRLLSPDGALAMRSTSRVDSVEHLVLESPGSTGRWCLEVVPVDLETDGEELYALASTHPLVFTGAAPPCLPDVGDAPAPHVTRVAEGGPRHLDWTREWLGSSRPEGASQLAKDGTATRTEAARPSASGENGAEDASDPDGVPNLDDADFDDGVLVAEPFRPGVSQEVVVEVETMVAVTGAGPGLRYDALDPERRLYLNGWADWNGDGTFDASEKIAGTASPTGTLALDPETFGADGRWTPGEDFTDADGSGAWEPGEDFVDAFGVSGTRVSFDVVPPATLAGELFLRFRLDRGEDAGAVANLSGDLDGPLGTAATGEVEDLRAPRPLLLLVEKNGSDDELLLTWSGGRPAYTVYESEAPERVVSPGRVRGETPATELVRPLDGSEAAVLFFRVGCTGAGCPEACHGGVDDDLDGAVDCDDPDCSGAVDCADTETACANGIDDDGDDLLDCEDPDCLAPCDDGDPCTVDSCDATAPGGCRNEPVDCDDGDACTTDSCDTVTGECVSLPVACDDGDACNGLESCDPTDGSCLAGTPLDCDDGDPCTTDSCDPVMGCASEPVDCDDDDPCTIDSCDPSDGNCLNEPVDCDDGDACNGVETCDPTDGSCLPGTPVDCDDGDPCTQDLCDPADGSCSNPPVDCDDDDPCTIDSCDPSEGSCLNEPVDCDDGDACNGVETCDPADGSCLPGTPVDCDDGDACTQDLCDPTDGSCSNPPVDCDDGDACNGVETCDPTDGSCLPGTPPDCDDGDPCTDDVCDAAMGCMNPPSSCDDGDACTVDSCDPVMGCQHDFDPTATPAVPAELAGNALADYPFFETVRSFNVDATVEVAIDPGRFPDVAGRTCDVYVVASKTGAEWCADPSLEDVRGMPDTRDFVAGSIADDTFPLVAPMQLSADAGTGLGVGYDVVLDCDLDGALSPDDFADGIGDEPGFFLVHDLTQPGSLATNDFDEIGPAPSPPLLSAGDDMRIYYPAPLDDPAFVGTFPLIVISHGNGHQYQWYDFLQSHLASYGYVVMSHDNWTFPGIETASDSTLDFTDRIIDEQATLGDGPQDGVLDGHLDTSRITWIGHSRGGEGVVRAYDRLHDEGFTPVHYGLDDIVLVASIAPTDFLGNGESNSHDVPYGLIYGAADGDVSGCADPDVGTSFNLYERSVGPKASHYVHGASHNDFNECGQGPNDGTGPALVGCPEAQQVQKAWTLALVKHHVEGNLAAKDYLWRQYESLRAIGVDPATVVVLDYRDAAAEPLTVLEDFETNPDTGTSSSGGAVSFTVQAVVEGLLDDADGNFDWTATDPMNGLTRNNLAMAPADDQRGVVFEHATGGTAFYELEVVPSERDFTDDVYLSLRAAQGTRHPSTVAALEDVTFTVTLVDGGGTSSSIGIGAYGGGIEEPYQRTGCGATGAGWQDELEVIRIRLTDFLNDGSGLDLSDVAAVRLELGDGFGSSEARLVLDDVHLTKD